LDSFEHVELFGPTSQPGLATIDFKTKVIEDLQKSLISAGLLSTQQIPSQYERKRKRKRKRKRERERDR